MKRSLSRAYLRATELLRELFLLPLHAYRAVISPNLAPRCKYYPSCSTYGVQAVRELGVLKGAIVAGWRVLADRRLFRDRERPHDHDHGHDASGVAA